MKRKIKALQKVIKIYPQSAPPSSLPFITLYTCHQPPPHLNIHYICMIQSMWKHRPLTYTLNQ